MAVASSRVAVAGSTMRREAFWRAITSAWSCASTTSSLMDPCRTTYTSSERKVMCPLRFIRAPSVTSIDMSAPACSVASSIT